MLNTQNIAASPKRCLAKFAQEATDQGKLRVLCMTCRGYGAAEAALRCLHCTPLQPCDFHTCRICAGKGVVCPRCQGMRFVSSGDPGDMVKGREYEAHNEDNGKKHIAASMSNSGISRCAMCCEGNQVNPVKEIFAIKGYLAMSDAPEWTARQKAADARKQQEAHISFITIYCRNERKRWLFKGHAAFQVVKEEAEAAYLSQHDISHDETTQDTQRDEVTA